MVRHCSLLDISSVGGSTTHHLDVRKKYVLKLLYFSSKISVREPSQGDE